MGRRGNSRNGTNAFGGQLKATTMTPLISQCTDVVYILLISGPTQLKALLILTGQGRTLEEGTIRNRGSRDRGSLSFFSLLLLSRPFNMLMGHGHRRGGRQQAVR